ncbi:pimeloyl-ACP methyl ester carboxylesterase [Novosphingobium sp. SG751A]|uniref:alpha/beta fold hydrolase n=1 Tax=Novosphingobium sp. SG751A TaxID=2587000 RepID=UPI0015541FEE|nr:alpha/beta hydrolase [Novosphingobium sp. SG751A]NOW48053.1 pimeloyl-ACP methyl ester carboxylesterase [Novosphingobium sp. SG751A]
MQKIADLGGRSLAYFDTGGRGPVIILLHAQTGSARSWAYQAAPLAKAGYRVIGYSRRGHEGSSPDTGDFPGRSNQDLIAMADYLGIGRFHLLGTAAGGFLALDFAMEHPERLLSLTLASTQARIVEPEFAAITASLTPSGFSTLPAEFREVGPSFRAACPASLAQWIEAEHSAKQPGTKLPLYAGKATWSSLKTLSIPTLLMTGDADLYMPPAHMARMARHFRQARFHIIQGAGHAAYWEQPAQFNAVLLAFLGSSRPRHLDRNPKGAAKAQGRNLGGSLNVYGASASKS